MKYIIFGKFSFNHIYFLLYAVFTLIRSILKDNINGNEVEKSFYSFYLVILSRLLAIIPFLIYKKLSKSKREKENQESKRTKNEGEIKYIYNDKSKETQKHLARSTFIVAIFEFLAESLICIFYFFNDLPNISSVELGLFTIFNTVTQYFGSYFILNYHFYKHHYLSFGINFACAIIFLSIDIIEIVKTEITEYQYYVYILLRILKFLLFAIRDNFAKKALYEEYLSTFALMLIMGLYEILFLAVFSAPFVFLKTKITNKNIFIEFLDFLKGKNLILSIFVFITDFAYEAFLLIIIDRFSPSHLPLAFLLSSFLYNLYFLINQYIKNYVVSYYIYLKFAFYVILFIAAMIHNEVIIINKCGFNKSTKMFLDMKLNEEIKEYKLSVDEDETEFDNQITLNEKTLSMEDMISID